MITVGFAINSPDDLLLNLILFYAQCNETALGNISIIFCKESGNTANILKNIISARRMPILPMIVTFNEQAQLDYQILLNKVRILFTNGPVSDSATSIYIGSDDSIKTDLKKSLKMPLDLIISEEHIQLLRQIIEEGLTIVKTIGHRYIYKNNIYDLVMKGTVVNSQVVITPVSLQSVQSNIKNTNIIKSSIYRVKIMCNWMTTDQLMKCWGKMSKNNSWTFSNKSATLHLVEDNPDYYVIINKPLQGQSYVTKNTIVYRMEPYIESNLFYNDWTDKKGFMYFLEHSVAHNNVEWWLNKSVDDLSKESIVKSNIISSVVSSQYTMEGHKLRIDFLQYLEKNSKYQVDIYGNSNTFKFSNHKGQLPERDKVKGLYPYKYTIAAENAAIYNYFTEKITDAILSECLCFYWGCPNLEDIIDSKAFVRLDLKDPDKSMNILESLIDNDEWSKRLPIIKAEKHRLLYYYNFFPRTLALIDLEYVKKYQIVYDKAYDFPITVEQYPFNIQVNADECNKLLRCFPYASIYSNFLGQAIIHIDLWRKCLKNSITYFISDSCIPNNNFIDALTYAYIQLQENDSDIQPISEEYISSCYLLSSKGANKLISIIDQYGLFLPLQELLPFLIAKNIITTNQSRKSSVTLIHTLPGEMIHIFKKNGNNYTNTSVKFNFPPTSIETYIVMQQHLNSIERNTAAINHS
jgi:hypothetical protein